MKIYYLEVDNHVSKCMVLRGTQMIMNQPITLEWTYDLEKKRYSLYTSIYTDEVIYKHTKHFLKGKSFKLTCELTNEILF